jgi:phosphoglycolate phosphatase
VIKRDLLLFDFDGVLVDSLEIYSAAVIRCLERIGTPIVKSREDFLDLFEGNLYESMEARGVNLAEYANAAREIMRGVDFDAMEPFDGLAPVLASLSREHRLVVISSNASKTIARMLVRFGFESFFAEVLGADFLVSKKEKIDHALAKYGVAVQRTFYIGDTAGDIREARAAGVRPVAVTWGWHGRERLIAAQPEFLIETPAGLLSLPKA